MILVTANTHPYLLQQFAQRDIEYIYSPSISYEEMSQLMPDLTGLVVTTRLRIDRELIDKAAKLKWIGRLGSGLELIDTHYANERNIACISTPEGNRNAVAEHALGMLLCLSNHILKANREVQQREWVRDANRGTEISGKTIGIIGYGNTGSAFAKLLSSFGVTILAYDKYVHGFGGEFIKEASFEQVCRYADVVSFHLPLNGETQYMANMDFFNSLGQKPFILNTSRGGIVHTEALINALNGGLIRGACLDVLENEKLSSQSIEDQEQMAFLATHPSVVLTPHIAGYSHESFLRMSETLIMKLEAQGFL
ncbi:MAG: hydroxyacid dehydrogenase [Ferruginibacter sp.]|nr:hydroxyacid dehydrogenase [Ferruginibacter sp.]